jgi:D-alanine-D-alanine ligase
VSRKKLRVMVLMHRDFKPPPTLEGLSEAAIDRMKTEIDVTAALSDLGHEVQELGVHDELAPIRSAVEEGRPHIVFNLLEEFQDQVVFDTHVVAYLELLRARYTGCNPRGLVLARDKALSKALASHFRIRAPRFVVVRAGRRIRRPKQLGFPLIVKSLWAESSTGIAKASIVRDDAKLAERVAFVHESIGTDAIVEEFVPGREIYASLLGNDRVQAFPPQEFVLQNRERSDEMIVTEKLKHDLRYQESQGVTIERPELPEELLRKLHRQSKRIYHLLQLDGYARLDWRLRDDGELFFLEANPNPEIAAGQEFAESAKGAGIAYEPLIQRILNLGLARAAGRGEIP